MASEPSGAYDRMTRQKRRQMSRDPDRPHAGPSAAVRNRKRLVQVQVADIRADRGRAGQTHLRVHVRAIHVDLTAAFVNDSADLLNRILEHTVR